MNQTNFDKIKALKNHSHFEAVQGFDLAFLEKNLNYSFKNLNLLKQALTHKSYSTDNYERLEFLGDAILNLTITEYLFKNFSQNEGLLSRFRSNLVKEGILANIAKRLNIGDYLKLGAGELHTQGHEKPSILADALEAIFAAIYLDAQKNTQKNIQKNSSTSFSINKAAENNQNNQNNQNQQFNEINETNAGNTALSITQKIIIELFEIELNLLHQENNKNLQNIDQLSFSQKQISNKDAKSQLQEYLQGKKLGLPIYKLLELQGETHQQTFVMSCEIPALKIITQAQGSTKKFAEQVAAAQVLEVLGL